MTVDRQKNTKSPLTYNPCAIRHKFQSKRIGHFLDQLTDILNNKKVGALLQQLARNQTLVTVIVK